jgi:hypothetical protein
MSVKKTITRDGWVPGPGKRQREETHRPDDESLVARMQLKDLVGVSNPKVITAAIKRLGIEPVATGRHMLQTYNNGGYGNRNHDVPYFPATAADAIHEEVKANAQEQGGKLTYRGISFRWT